MILGSPSFWKGLCHWPPPAPAEKFLPRGRQCGLELRGLRLVLLGISWLTLGKSLPLSSPLSFPRPPSEQLLGKGPSK